MGMGMGGWKVERPMRFVVHTKSERSSQPVQLHHPVSLVRGSSRTRLSNGPGHTLPMQRKLRCVQRNPPAALPNYINIIAQHQGARTDISCVFAAFAATD